MREKFRVWAENMETFLLEVILEERRGTSEEFVRAIAYGCSKLFQAAIKARRFLYNVRILRDSTLGVQVIAIGNLTVGGTGKTPVVEKFARELRDQGRNVAILSRGYRSKPAPLHEWLLNKLFFRDDTTPPRVVSDGKSLLLDSEMAGDEPYMLASNLKDVVVLVDKDRVKSGRYAIEKFGCDTLLLDDGFQYWKLRGRRQDIVLVELCASRRRTWRAQTQFLLRKAMVIPRNCAAELRSSIRPRGSLSASITRCIWRTFSPGNDRDWRFCEAAGWPPSVVLLNRRASNKVWCNLGRNWFIPSASQIIIVLRNRKCSTPSIEVKSARPNTSLPPKKTPCVFQRSIGAI